MKLRYCVVIPAFNEQEYLEEMVESIANQSILPEILVIVNDASDDNTGIIADKCAAWYPWIKVVHLEGRAQYATGSKIIETFLAGLNSIDWQSLDVISKLDADQIMPSDYFKRVLDVFHKHEDVGICGGVWALRKNDELVEESHTDHYHVRGGLKTWRRKCYQDIGGVRPVYGNDTLDELIAAYHGWRTVVLPDLKVELRRPTGTLIGGFKMHAKAGNMFYKLSYGPLIALSSSVKRILIKPYVLSAIFAFSAYLKACINREPKLVTIEQGRFIRRLRYKRMFHKLIPHKGKSKRI